MSKLKNENGKWMILDGVYRPATGNEVRKYMTKPSRLAGRMRKCKRCANLIAYRDKSGATDGDCMIATRECDYRGADALADAAPGPVGRWLALHTLNTREERI